MAKIFASIPKNTRIIQIMEKFTESSVLKDVWIYQAENYSDSRGSIYEWFNAKSVPDNFVDFKISQLLTARNINNVIRGIHFSATDNPQIKFVNCTSGKILDVVIDFREGSETFGLHDVFELDSKNCQTIMIPDGFGHGYQVISNEATVQYGLQTQFNFQKEYVVNPFDPTLGILWRPGKHILSSRDLIGKNFNHYFDFDLRLRK
jgi:dTDP-4-dehydrorhamnose 3,5-epimerase